MCKPDKINLMDALKRSLDPTFRTDRERRKRERTAKALAIAFHGDTREWRGFLSKADAFNEAYADALRHSPQETAP